MKKLLFILVLVFCLFGCAKKEVVSNIDGWKVIVIDDCEYIYLNTHYQGYLAHKGNCINH